jgi:peptide/nickel transport system substrate-binding protein
MNRSLEAHVRGATARIAVFALALLTGCGAPIPEDRGAAASPDDDGTAETLTILFESDDYVFGPSRDDSPKFLVFEPLVQGYGADATPGLAERWEHSEDTRTLTFHLRRDVVWHDGVPFTARDVAFTLALLAHPEVEGLRWPTESVETPDDYTVRITFSRPVGHYGGLDGWQVYYPRHLLEDLDPAGFYSWDFWKNPVGNGPYRYERGVANTMFELEANPEYFRGVPHIGRVVVRLSSANPVVELLSGNADAAYYVTSADIPRVASDPRFRVYYLWVHSEPQAIHWNLRHPFLADPEVRRALGHAIDRRELARLLYLPDEMPLVGGLSPEGRAEAMYRDGRLDQGPTFDPDLAERLLEAAGWVDRDGDGVRERDGTDARIEMLARRGGILSTLEPAVLLQSQLRHVGVTLEIRPVEPSVWRESWRAGDFDASMHDIDNYMPNLLQTDFFGDGTRTGYRNTEVVRLIEAIVADTAVAVQDSLFEEVNAILRRDAPFTPLFPYFEAYAAHRRVVGLRSPDRAHPIERIWELRLEPATP